MALSGEQIERYSRQIVVPEIGGRGQQRLLDAAVGYLGDSASLRTAAAYLAAAGVRVGGGESVGLQLVEARAATRDTLASGGAPQVWLCGESENAAWYTRRTAAGACPLCFVENGTAAAQRHGDWPRTNTVAPIAGAAMALDVIAEILGIAEPEAPALLVFGGTGERERIDLSVTACHHRRDGAGRPHGRAGAPD